MRHWPSKNYSWKYHGGNFSYLWQISSTMTPSWADRIILKNHLIRWPSWNVRYAKLALPMKNKGPISASQNRLFVLIFCPEIASTPRFAHNPKFYDPNSSLNYLIYGLRVDLSRLLRPVLRFYSLGIVKPLGGSIRKWTELIYRS